MLRLEKKAHILMRMWYELTPFSLCMSELLPPLLLGCSWDCWLPKCGEIKYSESINKKHIQLWNIIMNEHKKHLNILCGILTSKTWLAEQDWLWRKSSKACLLLPCDTGNRACAFSGLLPLFPSHTQGFQVYALIHVDAHYKLILPTVIGKTPLGCEQKVKNK